MRYVLNRIHESERVGRERRKRTDFHEAFYGKIAAVPHHYRDGEHAEKRRRSNEHAPETRSSGRNPVHIVRGNGEIAVHFILYNERFGSLSAGNAFIILAGYLRIRFPNFAIRENKLPLEIRRYQRNDRNDRKNDKRKLPVEREHDRK